VALRTDRARARLESDGVAVLFEVVGLHPAAEPLRLVNQDDLGSRQPSGEVVRAS
jgi:hypothetical protein